MRRLLPVLALLAAVGPALAGSRERDPLLAFSSRVSGPELARRIKAAAAYPLGSRENPVRVYYPKGEYEYLARLRCETGLAPTYYRVGNFGGGVYGSIIDGYKIGCPGEPPREELIYMDMYHPGYDEKAPVPGFRLLRRGGQGRGPGRA
jgi:hypothetical protein